MVATRTQTDRYGFPVVECTRCQGRGSLSGFSHVHGGVCFKCDGKGYTHRTGKAAKLAAEFYAAMRDAQRPELADVRVGDEIRIGKDDAFARVEEIENTGKILGTCRRGGEIVSHTYEYTYRLAGRSVCRGSSNLMVQRRPDLDALRTLRDRLLAQLR